MIITDENDTIRLLKYNERKRFIWMSYAQTIGAVIFMLAISGMVAGNSIKLYPGWVDGRLEDLDGRVKYAFAYQMILIACLMAMELIVVFGRIVTWAFNPMDDKTETSVQMLNKGRTNSHVFIVLSIFLQLTFAAFAHPSVVLRSIPLINIVQFIGSLFYFAGFPMMRTFGYLCTVVPNMIMCVYNVCLVFKLATGE